MDLLDKLARSRGIGDAYHDYRGELKHFSAETKLGILRAMGCPVDGSIPSVVRRKLLPPLAATSDSRLSIEIDVTARDFGSTLVWCVTLENGSRRDGATSTADCEEIWRGEVDGSWITRRRFDLPLDLPLGYHDIEAKIGAGAAERCLLIVSPPRCYEPPAIVDGRRLWGVAVQLYTLRSRANWGIGDFHDLETVIRWAARCGAGFVGLNPLHALAPSDPQRASPYSASNRQFLNVLYIAVPQVPEYSQCDAVQQRMASPHVIERLGQLRSRDLVDYQGVANLKFEILELLYRDFRDKHLATASDRGRSFRSYVTSRGRILQLHARFDALDRYFRATLNCESGWMNWPEEYRDVDGRAATRFAAEHPAEVEFYAYLQWLAHEQLLQAQLLGTELGMSVGLYGDYAVGANPSGSETWLDRGGYCLSAEIGAPPDPLALRGQGWGIPPQDPSAMLQDRLQGFIRLIRSNMRYYGALRLDHVMSLFRLWWVPGGLAPTEGAYVHYPLHQLLTVVALESVRAKCLVVGEDLGVVPDEMRVAMPRFGLYSYKVLLFEKVGERFRAPGEYERAALATVTTHDMPTLRSYWEGRDIDLRRSLNLYPSLAIENDVAREREHDRGLLLTALREQGLAPMHPAAPHEPFTPDLAQALHVYLARSTATLATLQIEDLLGMVEPVNVPGTHLEYPNWQRKVSQDVEDIAERGDLAQALLEINRARG